MSDIEIGKLILKHVLKQNPGISLFAFIEMIKRKNLTLCDFEVLNWNDTGISGYFWEDLYIYKCRTSQKLVHYLLLGNEHNYPRFIYLSEYL